jgi:hypothetical protein
MQWWTVRNVLHIDIVTWMSVIIRRRMDWVIGFFDTLYTPLGTTDYHSATANLRTLQFIGTTTSVLSLLRSPISASWQQILKQDL